MKEQIDMSENIGCGLIANPGHIEAANLSGHYEVECIGEDGEVKWTDRIDNLVTTVGKDLALDTVIAGSAYTATTRMGLKGTGSAVIGDTQASHAGWLEVGLANAPTYSGNRPVPSFSAASGGSKATSAAVSFSITGSGTVAGCFININGSATIDNTTGTLYSAGDFSGGSRTVANGDTINVTYTATA